MEVFCVSMGRTHLCVCGFVFWLVSGAICLAKYVRKLTWAPFITWIDDNCAANSILTRRGTSKEQLRSAEQVCFITCMVLFYAGYYVNLDKSVLTPTTLIRHLGIIVDSIQQKFLVPADRVHELTELVTSILGDKTCSLQTLEKCVGKCRSMAIAVPCAILYTRAQYATLAQNIDYM